MANLIETARVVKDIRTQAHSIHATNLEYGVSRGIYTPRGEGYDTYLPLFEKKCFEEIVEDKLREQNGTVTILDVGSGNNEFLFQCKRKWKQRVEVAGISAFPYRNRHLDSPYAALTGKDTLVTRHIGDLHRLSKYVVPNSIDVVTSVQTFPYLADPWSCLKSIYRVLKPQGIGLINDFRPSVTVKEPPQSSQLSPEPTIMHYLKTRYGVNFNPDDYERSIYNLSFKKSNPHLILPLHYDVPTSTNILSKKTRGSIDIPYQVMTYQPSNR